MRFAEYCTSEIIDITCLGLSNFNLRKELANKILPQKSISIPQRWMIYSTQEFYDEMFTVCKDAGLKFNLFMGHCMQCKNQQRVIQRIDEKKKKKFKIFRWHLKRNLNHYLHVKLLKNNMVRWVLDDTAFKLCTTRFRKDGSTKIEPVKHSMNIDEIMADGN